MDNEAVDVYPLPVEQYLAGETVLGYHFAMVKKTCQIIGAYIALYPVLSSRRSRVIILL